LVRARASKYHDRTASTPGVSASIASRSGGYQQFARELAL
jgi:hypothetical protein